MAEDALAADLVVDLVTTVEEFVNAEVERQALDPRRVWATIADIAAEKANRKKTAHRLAGWLHRRQRIDSTDFDMHHERDDLLDAGRESP